MARSKMIMVRVDEAEHALFKAAAAAVPVSMSEYARDAMLARMALEGIAEVEARRVVDADPVLEGRARVVDEAPWLVEEPAGVHAAVERVAPARVFRPDPKGAKPQKKTRVESAPICRHGLMRCKVCGSL